MDESAPADVALGGTALRSWPRNRTSPSCQASSCSGVLSPSAPAWAAAPCGPARAVGTLQLGGGVTAAARQG